MLSSSKYPAHHDQLRRANQLVPAAHARPPLHRAGETPVVEGDGHPEPAGVDDRIGEGREGHRLAGVHVGAGHHDRFGTDIRRRAFGNLRVIIGVDPLCRAARARRRGREGRPGGPGSGVRCQPRCSRPGPPRAGRPNAGRSWAWSPGRRRRSLPPMAAGPRMEPRISRRTGAIGAASTFWISRTLPPVPAKNIACGLFGP